MKKFLCISGIVTALLLTLLLTGWGDRDDTVKISLRQGNRQYEANEYKEALKLYETGITASPDNETLNFNAAQAAYILGEYDKAIEYYEKSGDSIEKFLNAGNICFRAGDTVEDANEKVEYYGYALQLYMEGISKYPQNVPLKYNYELVKEKLDALSQDKEQENEQGEGSEEQENQEQGDSEDSQGDQGEQGDQSDSEDSRGDQGQESENSESSQENQEQSPSQDEDSGDEQSQSQEGDGEQEGAYSQNEGEEAPDQETIERILQMLEAQEEESLKNNQEVVGGNEGKNGW